MGQFRDTPFNDEEIAEFENTLAPGVNDKVPDTPSAQAPMIPNLEAEIDTLNLMENQASPEVGTISLDPVRQEGMKQDLNMLTFLEGLKNEHEIQNAERNVGAQSSFNAQDINPFPIIRDEGYTMIHPDDMSLAISVIQQTFPSLSETGMLTDPNDRVFAAQSIMNNPKLRSDRKAPMINELMRNGKLDPEAFHSDWYKLRGVALQPHPRESL